MNVVFESGSYEFYKPGEAVTLQFMDEGSVKIKGGNTWVGKWMWNAEQQCVEVFFPGRGNYFVPNDLHSLYMAAIAKAVVT